jgi:beta-phosphoglucomutase-like phosphatase (HAD superfamily)
MNFYPHAAIFSSKIKRAKPHPSTAQQGAAELIADLDRSPATA